MKTAAALHQFLTWRVFRRHSAWQQVSSDVSNSVPACVPQDSAEVLASTCVCVCVINELAEIDEIVAAVKTPHDFRAFPR